MLYSLLTFFYLADLCHGAALVRNAEGLAIPFCSKEEFWSIKFRRCLPCTKCLVDEAAPCTPTSDAICKAAGVEEVYYFPSRRNARRFKRTRKEYDFSKRSPTAILREELFNLRTGKTPDVDEKTGETGAGRTGRGPKILTKDALDQVRAKALEDRSKDKEESDDDEDEEEMSGRISYSETENSGASPSDDLHQDLVSIEREIIFGRFKQDSDDQFLYDDIPDSNQQQYGKVRRISTAPKPGESGIFGSEESDTDPEDEMVLGKKRYYTKSDRRRRRKNRKKNKNRGKTEDDEKTETSTETGNQTSRTDENSEDFYDDEIPPEIFGEVVEGDEEDEDGAKKAKGQDLQILHSIVYGAEEEDTDSSTKIKALDKQDPNSSWWTFKAGILALGLSTILVLCALIALIYRRYQERVQRFKLLDSLAQGNLSSSHNSSFHRSTDSRLTAATGLPTSARPSISANGGAAINKAANRLSPPGSPSKIPLELSPTPPSGISLGLNGTDVRPAPPPLLLSNSSSSCSPSPRSASPMKAVSPTPSYVDETGRTKTLKSPASNSSGLSPS